MNFTLVKTLYFPSSYIKVIYHKRSLLIKLLDREERIDVINEKLNLANIEIKDKKAYLILVLKCAIQTADFVIFQSSKEELFCQFGVKDGYLMMDFPVSALNDHLPYLKKIRHLLEKLNFKFTDKTMNYMNYKYSVDEEIPLLDAHFGKNFDLAAEFISQAFEDIFNESISMMEVKLGVIER